MPDTIDAIHAMTVSIAKRTTSRSEAELSALSALQVAVNAALGTEAAAAMLVHVVGERDRLLGVVEGIMTERFELLREQLAALEHEQWIAWSQDIARTETISPGRLERWQRLWKPYETLTDEEKDQDREWADKGILIVRGLAALMWLTSDERDRLSRQHAKR